MTSRIDKKRCLKMYEQMLTIRHFEEKAIELFEHNLIRGKHSPLYRAGGRFRGGLYLFGGTIIW